MTITTSPLTLSMFGLVAVCAVMTIAWLLALRKQFFSLVDAVWALGIGLCAVAYHVAAGTVLARSLVSVGLVGLWSLRLGGYLTARLASHYPAEDTRYVQLRAGWAPNLRRNSFAFFQLQALTQALFAFPFAVTALDGSAFPNATEVAGVVLAVVGVVGESLADRQLAGFKRRADARGAVCDVGLWRYSRHPNYFFEWVIWCGFGLLALQGPMGAWALLCPAAMLLLLLFVTGVAPSEAQALRSRGEAYVRYQATTSRFIPWFPNKEKS